ncbi:MFS general substrate transporter [Naviculisporaceae sp. PSN 640]
MGQDIEKVVIITTTHRNPEHSCSSDEEQGSLNERGQSQSSLHPQEDDFVPPDGGLIAWSQVLSCLLVNMLAWGYPQTFGVYQLHYKTTLNLPAAQISWIGSLQTFLTFALCTPSGRLADAGYIRSTLAVGLILAVSGTFLTSFASTYWQIFLSQGVCTGLGLGIIFMPPMSVLSSYFVRNRAFALAVAATGTSIGGVVFPAMVQYLIPKVGFGWAVRCSGSVAAGIAAVAWLLLRPRLKPRRSGPWVEWQAFREAPYVLYMLGAFLFFWALYFGMFYINSYAKYVVGFSTVESVHLLLLTNALGVVSRPLVGWLSDQYLGAVNLYIITTMILSGMTFAWIGVVSRTGMYVFTIFFGLANGAAQGIFVGSLASLTSDPRKMGTRFGMVLTVAGFATLAGPPTAGAVIDISGGKYLWAQVWAGLVILLGSLALMGSRYSVTGWKLWVKI